jgi:hypothetical protein
MEEEREERERRQPTKLLLSEQRYYYYFDPSLLSLCVSHFLTDSLFTHPRTACWRLKVMMPLELQLHVFEASLRRKVAWLASLIKADYDDMDPIHVAHRSLTDERRRKMEEAAARAAEEGAEANGRVGPGCCLLGCWHTVR